MQKQTFHGLAISQLMKHSDLMIALGILGTLMVMLIPMSSGVMDILFVTSITISIAILLVSVYAGKPLDFSVFPTILLFSTLFRLSLNVASSRLILLSGHEGTSAAGRVIATFGDFVVGGSYIVGTVVFLLLIIINFIVITKGAGRVAEVAARFILDSMPGKQMAIDADMNSGLISEDQARKRRKEIEREADFYGAMDGASKFVRGDAIAGILITVINIIGGLSIGVFQRGLDVGTAAELYTLMTIGDGLVTQIPSLIVSTAAGIVVTRAATGDEFSKEVTRQILFQPRAIGVTSGILLLMGLAPGLPATPFLLLSFLTGGIAWAVKKSEKVEAEEKIFEERRVMDAANSETNTPPEVESLELQVGYGLVGLVEGDKSELIDRIYQLRKEFASDLGIVVPKVRIKDNLELQPTEYSILIRGVSVGGGELMSGYLMAMDPGSVTQPIEGIETKEPVFGLSALWISESQRETAQLAGYTVVESPTIIATHLSETIRKHAHELLGRQELQSLIENLAKTHPKVIEELIPTMLPLGSVLRVVQNLLREGVPVRDLLTIFETLANQAPMHKDPDTLTEFVRAALARTITSRLTHGEQELEVLTMGGGLQETLVRSRQKNETGSTLNLEPGFFEKLVLQIQHTVANTVFNSGVPVLVCHSMIRAELKRLIERYVPDLHIISPNEIASFVKLKQLGTLEA